MKEYNYNGIRYKRDGNGQWQFFNPTYNKWVYTQYNHPSVNGNVVYDSDFLEKTFKAKDPYLKETTTEKVELDAANAKKAQERSNVLNSALIPTQGKINYVSNNAPTIENANTLKQLQVQKQKEDEKARKESELKQQEADRLQALRNSGSDNTRVNINTDAFVKVPTMQENFQQWENITKRQKEEARRLVVNGDIAKYYPNLSEQYLSKENSNRPGGPLTMEELALEQIRTNPDFFKTLEERKYKDFQKREQKTWDEMPWYIKGINTINALASDPITTLERGLLEFERPLAFQGLESTDPSEFGEDARFYDRALNRDENVLNNTLNYINPFRAASSAGQNLSQGDYGDALFDAATIIPMIKGAKAGWKGLNAMMKVNPTKLAGYANSNLISNASPLVQSISNKATVGNLLTGYGGYEAAVNNFPNAFDAYASGDWKTGNKELFMGAAMATPLVLEARASKLIPRAIESTKGLFNEGVTGNSMSSSSSYDIFDLNNVKKPSGSIGNQGASPEGARDILKSIGIEVKAANPKNPTFTEMVEHLKSNPEDAAKYQKFLEAEPIEVYELPGGEYQLKDGHHRATLAYYSGNQKIPTIIKNKGEYTQASEFAPSSAASSSDDAARLKPYSNNDLYEYNWLSADDAAKLKAQNPNMNVEEVFNDKGVPTQETSIYNEGKLGQAEAFDDSGDFAVNWGVKDIDKYNEMVANTSEADMLSAKIARLNASPTNQEIGQKASEINKLIQDEYFAAKNIKSYDEFLKTDLNEYYKFQNQKISELAAQDPEVITILRNNENLYNQRQALINKRDTLRTKLAAGAEDAIDPTFKQKVIELYKQAGIPEDQIPKNAFQNRGQLITDFGKDRTKLVEMDYRDPLSEPSFAQLSDRDQMVLANDWKGLNGVRSDATITLGSKVNEPQFHTVRRRDFNPVTRRLEEPREYNPWKPWTWKNKNFEPRTRTTWEPYYHEEPTLVETTNKTSYTPEHIGGVNVHEVGHDYQKFYDNWATLISEYDPSVGYYTSHAKNPIAKRFKDAMVESQPVDPVTGKRASGTWESAPTELHSELMKARYDFYTQMKAAKPELSQKQIIDAIKYAEETNDATLFDFYNQQLSRHFKETTPMTVRRDLIKLLPMLVPAVGYGVMEGMSNGIESETPQNKYGGNIKTLSKFIRK